MRTRFGCGLGGCHRSRFDACSAWPCLCRGIDSLNVMSLPPPHLPPTPAPKLPQRCAHKSKIGVVYSTPSILLVFPMSRPVIHTTRTHAHNAQIIDAALPPLPPR